MVTSARILLPTFTLLVLTAGSAIFHRTSLEAAPPSHRTAGANLPSNVDQVFRRACKDCHSNETEWPWYSKVPPLSLAIAADVTRGRSLFNMSEWNRYSTGRKRGFLAAIEVDLARKNMPPRAYRWMHPSSNLSAPDELLLRTWAKQESIRLRSAAPQEPKRALQRVIPVTQYESLAPRV